MCTNDVIIPPHPPHPTTQCYFQSRMQKMTTVASLSDARHQKQGCALCFWGHCWSRRVSWVSCPPGWRQTLPAGCSQRHSSASKEQSGCVRLGSLVASGPRATPLPDIARDYLFMAQHLPRAPLPQDCREAKIVKHCKTSRQNHPCFETERNSRNPGAVTNSALLIHHKLTQLRIVLEKSHVGWLLQSTKLEQFHSVELHMILYWYILVTYSILFNHLISGFPNLARYCAHMNIWVFGSILHDTCRKILPENLRQPPAAACGSLGSVPDWERPLEQIAVANALDVGTNNANSGTGETDSIQIMSAASPRFSILKLRP